MTRQRKLKGIALKLNLWFENIMTRQRKLKGIALKTEFMV